MCLLEGEKKLHMLEMKQKYLNFIDRLELSVRQPLDYLSLGYSEQYPYFITMKLQWEFNGFLNFSVMDQPNQQCFWFCPLCIVLNMTNQVLKPYSISTRQV